MAEFSLPYERAAMRGDPMPDGLCIYDQAAFQALRCLYRSFRDQMMGRDAAAEEKKKILKALDDAVKEAAFQDRLAFHRAQVIRLTEAAKAAVRKNPSPENALQLVQVLDGLAGDPAQGGSLRMPACGAQNGGDA